MKLSRVSILFLLGVSVGSACANEARVPLVFDTKMSRLEHLFNELHDAYGLYEIKYVPDGGSMSLIGNYSKGPMVGFYSVKGTFEIDWVYLTNKYEIAEGALDELVEVSIQHGGDKTYRKLYPLTKIGSKEEAKGLFFVALGVDGGCSVLDLEYFGPFVEEERMLIRKMLTDMVAIQNSESIKRTGLLERELSASDSKWSEMLRLIILKQENRLTAIDFVSSPSLLTEGDVIILNDLFYQALQEGSIKNSLPAAIKYIIENDNDVSIAAVNHMIRLTESNLFGTKHTLRRHKSIIEKQIKIINSKSPENERLRKRLVVLMGVLEKRDKPFKMLELLKQRSDKENPKGQSRNVVIEEKSATNLPVVYPETYPKNKSE